MSIGMCFNDDVPWGTSKEFFGNYTIAGNHPVYETAGRITIRSDSNVKYHIDPIEDSVSIVFRRIDALEELISKLTRLHDHMLNLKR